MSATYLIDSPSITKIVTVVQPLDLITMGSAPINIYSKSNNLLPFYIVMNLTTGSIPYDFGALDYFVFIGAGGDFFDSVYTLQTIQNDQFVVGYARLLFKTQSAGLPPFDLNLTTVTGNDATQGDGVLTIYTYCISI
jgi:hypothetical protein